MGKNKSNKIEITRVYDAPVEVVWDAWADPMKAIKWMGPRGFTSTHHSKELKPGGHWHYTMHGPDGKDYENTTKYLEVEKNSRLVYDHGGHKDRPPLFRVTVNFIDLKGKTCMEMSMEFATPEVAEEMKKFIKDAGGNGTWDRLGEYLEKEQTGKEKFFINRTFEAPKETVFEMFTNHKHLAKWMGPTGSTMEIIRGEIKAGGTMFYAMAFAGQQMYGRLQYEDVKRSDHLVYTQQFTDKNENVSRHPLAPTWPETMRTIVQFSSEGADQTRVTIIWEPIGKVSKEEMDTFIQGRAGMTGGWTGSFDKLEDYLAKI